MENKRIEDAPQPGPVPGQDQDAGGSRAAVTSLAWRASSHSA